MRRLEIPALYASTTACLKFLNNLPRGFAGPHDGRKRTFHCYWHGTLGAKQSLSIKSFLATQNLDFTQLWLWLDSENGFSGYEDNPYLKPLLSCVEVKSYDMTRECRDTPLEALSLPEMYGIPTRRSNISRTVILFKYGGYYFDLDVLFLRNMFDLWHATPEQEFCYQWSSQRYGNSAVLSLLKEGKTPLYLIEKAIRCHSFRPMKLLKEADNTLDLLMLPCPFFDPAWRHTEKKDEVGYCPIGAFTDFFLAHNPEDMNALFSAVQEFLYPCFAYHWHNQWDVLEIRNSLAGYYNHKIDSILRQKYSLYSTVLKEDAKWKHRNA
jgi:hypothetical protein